MKPDSPRFCQYTSCGIGILLIGCTPTTSNTKSPSYSYFR